MHPAFSPAWVVPALVFGVAVLLLRGYRRFRVRPEVVLESVTDAFFAVDRRWRVMYLNRAAEQLSGCPRSQAVGSVLWALLPELSGTRFEEEYRRAMRTREPAHFHAVHPSRGGWYEVDVYPFRGGLTIYLSDATERKRAEHALRESEERFRLIFEGSPFPQWIFDLETLRILEVNEAAVQRYGFSREEFLEMTIRDLRPEADLPELDAILTPERQGLVHTHAFRHRTRSGESIEVEASTQEITFRGRPARVTLAVDVTERNRAQEALRTSERRFRELAEHIREGFWMFSSDLSATLYVNPAYQEITGRRGGPPYDAPGELLDMVHPQDRERLSAAMREAREREVVVEYRVLRGEQVRWLRARGFPIVSEGGEVHRIAGLTEDVTERKQAEAERARLFVREQEGRREAEEAVRERDEVIGIVSHDLRNPLHTISLVTDLLLDAELPAERRRENLRIVRRTVQHMERLIGGLLDMRRIEAGQGLAVEPRAVPVDQLIEEAHATFRPQVEEKGIQFACDRPAEELRVRADPQRVLQVFWNLVGNAVKFTPEGGRVSIRAERWGDEVRVAVSDSGPGVREEDIPRLFDPFWQAKRTARLGTGLGLPIARGIVEAHGGEIWVESQAGAGTTFFFTLPLVDAAGGRARVEEVG